MIILNDMIGNKVQKKLKVAPHTHFLHSILPQDILHCIY